MEAAIVYWGFIAQLHAKEMIEWAQTVVKAQPTASTEP